MSELPDWRLGRDHVIADDALWKSTEQHDADVMRPPWLRWSEVPSPAVRRSVRALRVRVSPMARPKDLPPALAMLPRCTYLSLPLSLAPSLVDGALPPALEVLRFDETPGGRAAIADDATFPRVVSLRAAGELRFAARSFPALREVSTKLGPRSPMLERLGALRKIESLSLGGLASLAPLARLTRLRHLGLGASPLRSLDGIEALTGLRSIGLSRMPKLVDLTALASLPKLESVDLRSCGALRDLSPLLRIRRLSRLQILVCRKIDLAAVKDALIAKELDTLAITGPRHLYRDGANGAWISSAR